MRLLRLEISGFKSFCDKTVLSFIQDGISVVVGPNGCGKSNLVDAVRWTLGEQSAKHLRGGSMEDVIFNGSSVRQPVSMAQVTLVFSNPEHDTIPKYAEFSEISATRRLYRSGESQYLINKTACRLTDIRELFMDTGIGSKGYSIIEQGKIDQIVTSRAEDRRSIIDEAAGIVKFKVKRKEAERKFAASKQNLLRVEDIIAELNRQEETLREQVAQAEIYIHTKARLERLQQCTAATRWFYLKEDINKITASLQKNQLSSEELTTSIATLDVQNASRQLELSTKEAEQEDLRRTIQTHKEGIIKLESKLETDRVAIENLDEWQKKGLEENELISRQIKTIEFQIVSYKKDSENFEKKAAEITIQLNRLLEFEKVKERELVDKRSNLEKNQSEELQMVKRMNDDQNQLKQSRERLEEINQGEISTRSQLDQAQAESLHLDGHLELALKSLDEKVLDEKEKLVQKPKVKNIRVFTSEMQKLIDDKTVEDKTEKEGLNLSSKKYFEVYKQWQAQGVSLDKGKKLVALRIQNLEKVYELFQMKAVVLKENTPHTDIGDGSRIAVPSLSEFSSTCFVVSDPWKKWGQILEDTGFSRADDIQVRYYTYEFVRNAIYARAMKAFEWSLKKKNLPLTTDPAQADVLGIVYSVNKDGGGAFGVFVPKRVDFKSKGSVIIDPQVCFAGQKDIEELNRAGLL